MTELSVREQLEADHIALLQLTSLFTRMSAPVRWYILAIVDEEMTADEIASVTTLPVPLELQRLVEYGYLEATDDGTYRRTPEGDQVIELLPSFMDLVQKL